MRIDVLRPADRPREKLLERGAATLGVNELLAMLLGAGTRSLSALELANGYCQVGELRPNIVGLEDAPSTISWGRIGLEALNLTIPNQIIPNSFRR